MYKGDRGMAESRVIEKQSRDGDTIKCEVFEEYGSPFGDSKWQYRLTKTAWNGREPKYDLRQWSSDGQKYSKGLTFTDSELYDLLSAIEDALGC